MAYKKFENLHSNIPTPTNDNYTLNTEIIPRDPSVHIGYNGTGYRSLNFSKFYNCGYDEVTSICQSVFEQMIHSSEQTGQGSKSKTTIAVCFGSGLNYFFQYCSIWLATNGNTNLRWNEIDADFVDGLIDYLRSLALAGIRQIYQRITVVLIHAGLSKAILPKRVFTTQESSSRSSKGYTKDERSSIIKALNYEVGKILKKADQLIVSELCYLVAWIIIRTGLNRQPVIEMPIDAIKPHPFHAHKRLLVTYKRRGNSTNILSFTSTKEIESIQEVPPQLDLVIDHVGSYTSSARDNTEFPNNLFLYMGISGIGTPVTAALIDSTMKLLIKNHKLVSDNGLPLKLNMSRLRTTWINRIYELSGFDIYLTSALAGHKNTKITNDVYLEAPKNAERDHAFMGEVRNAELLTIKTSDTSVAKCSDIHFGHRAPKDGSVCVEVISCFLCDNFLITEEDLFRLFSFYYYIVSLRRTLGSKQWAKQYAHIVRIIDRDISSKFSKNIVKKERERAKQSPHALWRIN